MGWLDEVDGITDEHKAFATENKIEGLAGLFGLAQKTPSWTEGLSEDHRGFLESKGVKDASTFVDSYRNLEKTVGVPPELIVKLPKSADDAEAWGGVYNKLGRPEEATGYDITAPEGAKTEEQTVKWAQDTFYKLGFTKNQGEGFIKAWNDFSLSQQAEVDTQKQYDDLAAQKELRMLWGQKYEKNIGGAMGVAKQLGIKPEEIDSMEAVFGKVRTMEMLSNINEKSGELGFVDGESAKDGTLSPAAAKYKMRELMGDSEWVKAWSQGGIKEREEIDRLNEMALAGDFERPI